MLSTCSIFLSFSKWMLQTSRHFTPNYFSMNHLRQGHFPIQPQYITFQKIVWIQSHGATSKISSVVAKMSVMNLFYPIEDSVNIDELSLVMSLQFLTICRSPTIFCHSPYLILWRVQPYCLTEQPTFCINKYVYDLT